MSKRTRGHIHKTGQIPEGCVSQTCLTTAGLHADLQTQVVHWTHYPQVACSSDVKLQPALLGGPQPAGLQQKEICLSEG